MTNKLGASGHLPPVGPAAGGRLAVHPPHSFRAAFQGEGVCHMARVVGAEAGRRDLCANSPPGAVCVPAALFEVRPV